MTKTPPPPHYDEELKQGLPIIADLGKKPPRFRYLAVIFFIQGISLLFAFNAMINSVVFFNDRANGALGAEYVMDYYLIAFAFVRFLAMVIVPVKMRGGSPYRQIWMSQIGNMIVFLAFALLNIRNEINPWIFMIVTIIVVIALSIFSVIAFFGIFTIIAHIPGYSERLSTVVAHGQGAAGTIVCLLKLISIVFYRSHHPETTTKHLDSLLFFLFFAALVFVSICIFIPVRNVRRSESMLILVPIEKIIAKSPSPFYQPPKAQGPYQEWMSYYFSIYKQIPVYFWSTFILFFQTMTLVPTFIFMNPAKIEMQISAAFYETRFFVIFNLLLYNLGDWFGRIIVGIHALNIKNKWALLVFSILRFGLMPFYLLNNLHLDDHLTTMGTPLGNDIAFCFVNFIFGLSAGYLVTCIMENAPNTVKEPKDKRFALFILMHCMTFALFIGSIFSFILELLLHAYALEHY